MLQKPVCRHCGSPLIDERMEATGFCCAGCSFVYRLVHENGLEGYYRIKDRVTAPADPALFQPRDLSWLRAAEKEAETDSTARGRGDKAELTMCIQGISCAGCVWLIERLFKTKDGARDIIVNAQTGRMHLSWVPSVFSPTAFAEQLQSFGYLVGPCDTTEPELESPGLVKRIGLCSAFAMNVMLFTLPTYFGMEATFEYAPLFGTISLGFGTLSLLVGGSYFIGRAIRALREGVMHIDLPIALGIAGAYLGSLYGWLAAEERFVYFDFVSTFILLMLIGRWAQLVAVERNQRQLLRQQYKPGAFAVESVPDGNTTEKLPENLSLGDVYHLKAGQTNPVEAELLDTTASWSLVSINGEAEPRILRPGELVPSGAVQVSISPTRLKARQTWRESLFAQLLRGVEKPGWRHRFLERIIRGYLIGILLVALLAGILWWWTTGDIERTWAVVTAVLVVSCPCAIGLAFPLADEMAATALRRHGVYVRENDLWTKIGRVRHIIFDKTGTLTLETPALVNVAELSRLSVLERSALHALVHDNSHPLSQTLRAELLASGSSTPLPASVTETIGAGLELIHEGVTWSLGKPGFAGSENAMSRDFRLKDPAPQETTADEDKDARVVFCRDGRPIASFHFHDQPRAGVRQELHALQQSGFIISILSGDAQKRVAALANELGIEATRAVGDLNPLSKAAWIDRQDRRDTMMLGDGANDSLAFDRALCRGTPVIHRGVLEQKSDFFYLGQGIAGIRALFGINAVRHRTQVAILLFSVIYNALAVGLAVAGHMNPLVAAALMPINSLLTLAIVSIGMRTAFTPNFGRR